MNSSNSNKYKANRVYYDFSLGKTIKREKVNTLYRDKSARLHLPFHVIVFDSHFEYRVYKELVNLYGSENVFCHHPIELFPPSLCYPLGKVWKVDFAVYPMGTKDSSLLVEAKGIPTDYFLSILATLEVTNLEAFSKLYLLFDKKIPNYRVIDNLVKANNSYKKASKFVPKVMTLKNFIAYKRTTRELIKR